MSRKPCTLEALGWNDGFKGQLTDDERETLLPARIVSTHRGHIVAFTGQEEHLLLIAEKGIMSLAEQPTVGDWVLLDRETLLPVRLLDRTTVFKRMASGTDVRVQPIAANVDTLFIVTSCNRDFNLNRIERYLCLALDAGAEPVLVLTKTDLADEPQHYMEQARTLGNGLAVVPVNARDTQTLQSLSRWFLPGRTIAMLGSSGVGKTTLLNTINGAPLSRAGSIRQSDDRGRHTTTTRALHQLASGALLVDMPGIRELQLHDCEDGIETVFGDLLERIGHCRFADCSHDREPGCAVREAIEQGEMDRRHVDNYFKLLTEQAESMEGLRKKRQRTHRVTKQAKVAKGGKRRRR